MREYGRGVMPGVARPEVDALKDGLFGVAPTGGPPLTLWEKPFWLEDGARVGCFLSGDSGLGRDGRRGLNILLP